MITAAAEADLFSPRRTVPGVGCLVKAWATEAAAASNSSTVSAVAATAAVTAATEYCKHMRHVSACHTFTVLAPNMLEECDARVHQKYYICVV